MDPGVRNFRAVWPSLFATSMGLMAFLPVLALYVKERFGVDDPAELRFLASVIYGAAPFAAAVAGPFWGALGDRTGKKPMAIRANLAIAVTTALMPLAPTPGVLLAMRLVQGALAGYVAPAMSLVSQGTADGHQGRMIAKLQVAMASGSFVGPFLGAQISLWLGRPALFWVASALSLFAALQLHLFAHEERRPPAAGGPARPFLREFASGTWGLLRQPAIGWLLVLLLLLRLGQNMLEPLLSLFVHELGAAPWIAALASDAADGVEHTIAFTFAVLAVAQWICTPIWGRCSDRFGPLRCLGLLALGLGGLFAWMGTVTTIGQFLLVRCCVACLMAGSMTLAYSAAQRRVTDQNRTLAFAMVQSCIQYGLALGPLLAAFVAGDSDGADSFRRAFAVAATLCAVAGLGMLVLRARTQRPTVGPRADAVDPGAE
ncbi:MAG: MFS transporter [Planctomycetes bacterium]|nr:MFS transporter [Planctomycetota bacterium]